MKLEPQILRKYLHDVMGKICDFGGCWRVAQKIHWSATSTYKTNLIFSHVLVKIDEEEQMNAELEIRLT